MTTAAILTMTITWSIVIFFTSYFFIKAMKKQSKYSDDE